MNLKLYTRPYSAKNLKLPAHSLLASHPSQSSRVLTTISDTYQLQTSRPYTSTTTYNETKKNEESIPDTSSYQIGLSYPERPKSSHLSGFTVKENNKMLNKTKAIRSQFSPEFTSTDLIRLPSEEDLNKILTKLEMVSTNRTAGTRRIMMNEGDIIEIMLEAGETQYFTINSKGKKPPMIATVKVNKGRVISYVSKVHSEPSREICEISSKNEIFQVKDVSLKFKVDAIYIGIEALTDTIFHVSVSFGQAISMKTSKSLRVTQEEREIIEKPDRDFNLRKKKKIIIGKDFVKMNIEKNGKQYISGNRVSWDLRKDIVKERRKQYLYEKKQKILEFLNRRKLAVGVEAARSWLGLIWFLKCSEILNRLRGDGFADL